MASSEKTPVLNVKKEAHKDVVFHYKRDERYRLPGAPPRRVPRNKQGILRRNPSLKILILDVIFILLLSAGIRFFFLREQPSGRAAGCEFHLSEVLVKDKLFVTLEVRREEGEGDFFPVTLMLEPGGESRSFRATLPGKRGGFERMEVFFTLSGKAPQRVRLLSDDSGYPMELWINVRAGE